ncbi:MAG: serine hydrolase domain-containing protein [Sphaerochaetaceae bacterium]|jgi:CubicO group peptidase (beta-lactamase class C family)|nr:beta-lactamase family protein [Sphaerochaetaceae bacterium]MDD4258940.1 serine hydrolase [Sphaerochaetaceae bacterium]MDD4840689.1 serine hydrolase [Sphaerochaetaceae bacterium]MDX9935076.1 serine hydrolase domain-containing protein [Sphaerochaetaceae bacterium]NLO59931.1 beta-lactamase family protein [Spirochaetales bacterium]
MEQKTKSKGQRMWWLIIIFFLLLGVLIALLSGSLQVKPKLSPKVTLDQFKAHMDEMIPNLMGMHEIPGCSIALVVGSEIAWTKAYGYADKEDRRILTTDTPMSVQSITKSLTAWAVMNLVEHDAFDLDAPVLQYLDDWQFPATDYQVEKVTVRNLLNHGSGMPLGDFTDMYAPGEQMPTLKEKLSKEAVLTHEPGLKFSYSNVGYHVLELLIEQVSGKRFSEYMLSEVFVPMGLKASFFDFGDALRPYPPTGYDLNGNPVPVYLYPEKSSGGLFSTAEDIAQFAVAGMKEHQVLGDEHIRMMYAPERDDIGMYGMVFDAYGFGHYIETLPNGMLSVSHGGQGYGIMTHFQVVPKTGDAIVVLTNSQRSWPLIAFILSEWARWRDFPSVGMGNIIRAHIAMSTLIALMVSVSILIAVRLILTWSVRKPMGVRLFKCSTAIMLIGILAWSVNQPYLFVVSVFPVLSPWLGLAALLLSASLLLSGLLPEIRRMRKQQA